MDSLGKDWLALIIFGKLLKGKAGVTEPTPHLDTDSSQCYAMLDYTRPPTRYLAG